MSPAYDLIGTLSIRTNSVTLTLLMVLFFIWISLNFLLHFLKISKYTFLRIKKHKIRKTRMAIAASYFLYPLYYCHHFFINSNTFFFATLCFFCHWIIFYALFIRACSLFYSIWIYISLYFLPILWQIYFFIFACSVFFVCSILNSMSSL